MNKQTNTNTNSVKKRSSIIRKCQIVFGVAGTVISVVVLTPGDLLDSSQPVYKPLMDFLFPFATRLSIPTYTLCALLGMLGIKGTMDPALLTILTIVVNIFLSLLLGTLIGWLIEIVIKMKQTNM
jgi:hypothetical protein